MNRGRLIVMKQFWNNVKKDQRLKSRAFWLRFFAYGMPFAFLLYMLYWNFLPFGYDKEFVIDVGSPYDMSGEFRLKPSEYLSDRMSTTTMNGLVETWREVSGPIYAVYNPSGVLRDKRMYIDVEGDNVTVMPLEIIDDYSRYDWDYIWDFTHGSKPSEFYGKADFFSNNSPQACAYFDGNSGDRLELSNSADLFEDQAFSVYVNWQPDSDATSSQQIVGHYNWELFQNRDSVVFQVGRMSDQNGPFFSIRYPVTPDFFGRKHSALAIYNPSNENGRIDLYIDERYVGRTYFQRLRIWPGYNSDRDLSFGKSEHGNGTYFTGCIFRSAIMNGVAISDRKNSSYRINGMGEISIPLMTTERSVIRSVILRIND